MLFISVECYCHLHHDYSNCYESSLYPTNWKAIQHKKHMERSTAITNVGYADIMDPVNLKDYL